MTHTTHDQKMLALVMAETAHAGQKRWGGEDYFATHLVTVAKTAEASHTHCVDSFTANDLYAVGILHDILEDTNTKEGALRDRFTDQVVDAVVAMTHLQGESYGDYLNRLVKNRLAARVKLHDLAHNLSTLGEGNPKKHKQRRGKYQVAATLCRLALIVHAANSNLFGDL